ncbi:MAG: hypothetical protein ABIC04_07475 [Nanoarchaeota archaeon]
MYKLKVTKIMPDKYGQLTLVSDNMYRLDDIIGTHDCKPEENIFIGYRGWDGGSRNFWMAYSFMNRTLKDGEIIDPSSERVIEQPYGIFERECYLIGYRFTVNRVERDVLRMRFNG